MHNIFINLKNYEKHKRAKKEVRHSMTKVWTKPIYNAEDLTLKLLFHQPYRSDYID